MGIDSARNPRLSWPRVTPPPPCVVYEMSIPLTPLQLKVELIELRLVLRRLLLHGMLLLLLQRQRLLAACSLQLLHARMLLQELLP